MPRELLILCFLLLLAGTPTRGQSAPLFDGSSLSGWGGEASFLWQARDGFMVGGGNPQPRDFWLTSDRSYENFDLTFQARTEGKVGAGLFFRAEVSDRRILGWQCDIGHACDGGLYKEGPRGGKVAYPPADKVAATVRTGQWNEYRVRAEGGHLRTWVNGVPMAEHREIGPRRLRGRLALEISAGGDGRVYFRDFRMEELPPSPDGEAEVVRTVPMERLNAPAKPAPRPAPFAGRSFSMAPGEVAVLVGGENMVTEQRHGELESHLAANWREQAPRFRHMSWEGDTVFRQNRMMEWGSWRENLAAAGATMVVAWFGQVEALDPARSTDDFRAAYARLLDEVAAVTPRIVVIGPLPFERPADALVPDNTRLNSRLADFNAAARELAQARGWVFVDLFEALPRGGAPLTRNGMHLTAEGSRAVGQAVAAALGSASPPSAALRAAVAEKNRLWFDTWRCMNWAFAYGDRTTTPFARPAANHPSFADELKRYLPLLDHAEAVVHARARGLEPPPPPPPGPPRADPPALTPAEQQARFQVRSGFAANLFADESLGLRRPVQIRWDERGRLWAACIPSYPQLQPGEHGNDFILVLEDTDGDGRADRSARFAEGLTMPMGFEFAPDDVGGGLYVLESTQLVHLPDRDRDGRADGRHVILSGFGTGDSHQNANSLRWGPDGALWFTQGYHIWSYVETPRGLAELNRSGLWRFNPRTLRLDSFLNESTAGLNCWGTAWDDFGQMFHGSGADFHIWHTTPGLVPTLHVRNLPTAFARSRGKSMEPEFLGGSHLPPDLGGVLMKSTYFTSQVQLYRLRDQGSSFDTQDLGDLISGGNEFRPVESRVGPDGAIYVADWLNPVIGHYQASYRDPRRDRSHGRIWRVSAQGRPLARPALAGLRPDQLVARLGSPEPWERAQAKALLYRLPRSEVAAAIGNVDLASADGRMLHELSGVLAAHEMSSQEVVRRLLASDDFRWRAWGARLLGVWGDRLPEASRLLEQAVRDSHPRVRMEAVVACGWQAGRGAEAVCIAVLALDKPMDPALSHALALVTHALAPEWKPALLSGALGRSMHPRAVAYLLAEAKDPSLVNQAKALLSQGGDPAALAPLAAALARTGSPADLLLCLGGGRPHPVVLEALAERVQLRPGDDYAAATAKLLAGDAESRMAALGIVAATRREQGQSARLDALWKSPGEPAEVRSRLLLALARARGKAFVPEILPLLAAPDLGAAALAALSELDLAAAAAESARHLALARSSADIAAALSPLLVVRDGPVALAAALRQSPPAADQAKLALAWMSQVGRDDPEIRLLLQEKAGLGGQGLVYGEALVREWVARAESQGDARRGEAVFRSAQAACLACHKAGGQGGAVGPELSAIARAQTKEAIVESVLWPKRQVKEGYLLTVVATKDGRSLQGYRVGETADTLSLRDFLQAAVVAVPKRDISSRSDVGSNMPEGIFERLAPAEQADLLRYLFELR